MSDGDVARGRILRTAGGRYEVETEDRVLECSVRGRLKREKGIGRVAPGDEVELEILGEGGGVIVGILPRSSRLSRRSADGRREQIIATNVDQLAAVFAVAEPEPLMALVDRFLVLAEANEIRAFVVVNKIDLAEASDGRGLFDLYERIGYEVLYVSAKTRTDVQSLTEHLAGHLTLFVGPSGAGKSSLLNALQPGLGLRVGEVSRVPKSGRHTTVAASLHPLDGGGYVVDTPGLAKLEFWAVGTRELAWCFPEFRPYLGACKFGDCRHLQEPGCAVREAVESGDIPGERYRSYEVMREEAEAGRPDWETGQRPGP